MRKNNLWLCAFFLLSSCASSRYEEPVRIEYQLNKFGALALSNSPQFAITLVNKGKQFIFLKMRNLVKNLDTSQSFTLFLNKGYLAYDSQKIDLNCQTLMDGKTNDLILAAQRSTIIECTTKLNIQARPKDTYFEAFLPVQANPSLQWSFILKAEDLK